LNSCIYKRFAFVRLGASVKRAPFVRRSFPVNSISPPSKWFESPLGVPPSNDIEAFLAVLRFEKRYFLAELLSDLLESKLKQVKSGEETTGPH
jgi:hypothetical protein